ncbi:MAG: GNAT family N-acetyltransferase [Sphingobacteriia bacterium]|nr:GNAT family N-acetyltransferase [Sphingobacteriia bacterium]
MQFEDIKTNRLLIREYSDQYLEQLFEYRSDPRVYLWYTKKQNSVEDLKEYFKSNITEFNKDNGYAGVDYNNKASIGLLKKLGFRREGYFRQTEYKKGEWKDSCLYAILREDWVKNNNIIH